MVAFLAKHPQAGHGKAAGKTTGKGGKAPGTKEENISSLVPEMAKATGKDARTSQRDCRIAENIPQEARDAIRDTPVAAKWCGGQGIVSGSRARSRFGMVVRQSGIFQLWFPILGIIPSSSPFFSQSLTVDRSTPTVAAAHSSRCCRLALRGCNRGDGETLPNPVRCHGFG